jgi:hypothetical protein
LQTTRQLPHCGRVRAELKPVELKQLDWPLTAANGGRRRPKPGFPYETSRDPKLRGKQLVIKPGRTRRYHVPGDAARTITALRTVRDKLIAPLISGIRTPRRGRPPKNWTKIDRDYETIRLDMQTLFNDLGISTKTAAT